MNFCVHIVFLLLLSTLISCAPKQTKKTLADENITEAIDVKALKTVPLIKDSSRTKTAAVSGDYVQGQIHVKLKSDQVLKLQSFDAKKEQLGKHPHLQNLIDNYKVSSIQPAFKGLDTKIYVLSFQTGIEAESIIKAMQEYDFVEYAEQIPLNK